MCLDELADERDFVSIGLEDVDELPVAMGLERMRRIVDVGHATVHARREVDAHLAQDEHAPTRHVLAAVVADSLDDQVRTRVARGEALPGEAVHEAPARRRAVEGDVAHDDVFLGPERRPARWGDRDRSTRKPLAEVIVCLARNREHDALGQKRAKAHAARPAAVDPDEVVGQPLGMMRRHVGTEHGAHATVHVRDVHVEVDGFETLARELRVGDEQRRIECLGQRIGSLGADEEMGTMRVGNRAAEIDLRLGE